MTKTSKKTVTVAVKRITVDDASDGQRLDNFLIRECKGVPKSHLYRIVRQGEVRVNKARAKASTKLHRGDEIRIPPIRQGISTVRPAVTASMILPVLF